MSMKDHCHRCCKVRQIRRSGERKLLFAFSLTSASYLMFLAVFAPVERECDPDQKADAQSCEQRALVVAEVVDVWHGELIESTGAIGFVKQLYGVKYLEIQPA